jgi:hypothetical protein
MSGLFFLLFFLSITSLFLFERVYICVKREDVFIIEIHFVFFVLVLRERKKRKKNPDLSKGIILRSVFRLCQRSQLELKKLTFNRLSRGSLENFESYYRYRALAGALVTLASQNSEELSTSDDFFTVDFSHTSPPTFDVNIVTYVVDALIALSPLLLSLITKKRKSINA